MISIIIKFTWMLTITIIWLQMMTCSATNFSREQIDRSTFTLLGSSDPEPSNVELSFQVWANPRKSATKPRKRDLYEPKLMLLLGNDFDHRWMRKNKEKPNTNGPAEENERKAVRALRALMDNSTRGRQEDLLQLPQDLPAQFQELVKNWLVRRATCPIRFTWSDLGPYFWPRYVKRGECIGNMTCSWPPGMTCTPGAAKILNILRWHCRLKNKGKRNRKKKTRENSVSIADVNDEDKKNERKKRKKYRCMWIKVPYPVPEDCICACKKSEQ